MLASSLKQKIRQGGECFGVFMTFDFWPGHLEIMKRQGVDFVVLDMEHGQVELPKAEELCRTARLLDLPLLIRPQSCAMDPIKRSLDLGAGGLMVPWMETQEQLDTLRAAAFCPPRGRHGMGGPVIMTTGGATPDDWAKVEESLAILCQIESPAGIEFAPVIASQPWVDSLMVGPYDLAHNMGLLAEYMKAPAHIAAIERIGRIARDHGKAAGMVVGTGEQTREWFDKGFQLVICGCVMGHFAQGLSRNLAAARRRAAGQNATPA
ncbi:MAG TPA: aldolase/citrate lyase family protein [Candidatus Brocadiia bacterium]|mgnify:CR=1 FL=1|nr:aldolase/citrate lyase family protein [Candidatus Brocadiia bacterium]